MNDETPRLPQIEQAEKLLHEVFALLDMSWPQANGKQRVYLADATCLLERAGGKLAKAARGSQAVFRRDP